MPIVACIRARLLNVSSSGPNRCSCPPSLGQKYVARSYARLLLSDNIVGPCTPLRQHLRGRRATTEANHKQQCGVKRQEHQEITTTGPLEGIQGLPIGPAVPTSPSPARAIRSPGDHVPNRSGRRANKRGPERGDPKSY